MKLYHGKRTRSFRVVWMLEEMGLPYEIEAIPFPPTGNPVLAEVNALTTLPTLVDGAATMTESAAILEYLGRCYGPTPLAPAPDHPSYGDYLNYLHYGEASLAAPLSQVMFTRWSAPEDQKANWTVGNIEAYYVRRAAHLEGVLTGRPYVAGDAFTAADISCGYALRLAGLAGLTKQYGPVLKAYLAALAERPAYIRASAV